MITPNKVISLDESAMGRLGVVIREGPQSVDLITLYNRVAKNFASIDEFILTLDVLFVLGRINVNPSTRTVTYAE
jgi:hypothetical protein